MNKYDAIVNPVKGKNSPDPGSVSVMVSGAKDLSSICCLLDLSEDDYISLMMSRFFRGEDNNSRFSVIGPVIGASYATILLETLIIWEARKILFFGCCGAVSDHVHIGDIIVPTSAIIDEGVSKHYDLCAPVVLDEVTGKDKNTRISFPSEEFNYEIKNRLIKSGIHFHEGLIWSTDAVYRETYEKVACYKRKDVLGVEMEISALFSVGKFRNVELAAILVVSDELSSFKWRPGFKDERFKKSCKKVSEVISSICKTK